MKSFDSHFSPDYFSARTRFRESAASRGARLQGLPMTAKGPNAEKLTIDIAWFGSESPRRLLLHSSGLHGIEGFAGSAVQLQLLDNVPALSPDAALVIVHILNPYGMSWLRRVNENNVDLNRNFRPEGSYDGAPATYANLDAFLNPRSRPSYDFFFSKAACYVFRYGLTPVKQSVAGGQYEFPHGLFFGGKQLEEGPRIYEAFLKERAALSQKAMVIDVHTGLGEFAEDSLLVESDDYARLRNIFGERVTALDPTEGSAYRIEGGLQSMIFRVFFKTRPTFVGQEFGTYNNIKVLHALREENRWHHYGDGNLNHPTKHTLKETFCPDNESWRETVLKRGREVVERALEEL